MILNKPLEYWAVVGGMALWLFTSTSQKENLPKRLMKTVASGVLAIGLSTDAAKWWGVSESLATVAIMAFGLIVLDAATAVISDKKFLTDIIRKKIGGNYDE